MIKNNNDSDNDKDYVKHNHDHDNKCSNYRNTVLKLRVTQEMITFHFKIKTNMAWKITITTIIRYYFENKESS